MGIRNGAVWKGKVQQDGDGARRDEPVKRKWKGVAYHGRLVEEARRTDVIRVRRACDQSLTAGGPDSIPPSDLLMGAGEGQEA